MVVYAGVFETEDKAKEANDKLIEAGFDANDVFVITPTDGAAKVKELLASARNADFRGMVNRMKAVVEGGQTLVAARTKLFYARQAERTFEEVGATKVLSHYEKVNFFSEVIGLPSMIIRGRPRVTLWKKPVTESLGKTMLYKRPVTETLGKTMLYKRPVTEKFGKTMIYKNTLFSRMLGIPLVFSEIKKGR